MLFLTRFQRFTEARFTEAFSRFGNFVGLHPLPFLLCPLFLTAAFAYGLYIMEIDMASDRVYLASNSQSLTERQAYVDFLSSESTPYFFDLLVARKDRGNMLVKNHTNFILDLHHDVYHKLHVNSRDNSTLRHFSLATICEQFTCMRFRDEMETFTKVYYDEDLRTSPIVQLTYPIMKVSTNIFNLGYLMSNVTTHHVNRRLLGAGVLRIMHVVMVPSIDHRSTNRSISFDTVRRVLKEYGLMYEEHFGQLKSQEYDFFVHYFDALSDGMGEVSRVILPYLAVSIACLIAFTVSSSFTLSCMTSKPLEALAGVLNPCLAIVSAVGFLNLCSNWGWNGMASTLPFLVLSIGVDDMFVLLASWHATDSDLPPEKRLGEVMGDAGLSVMITSLTNVISFATGVTQNTPAVQVFSAYAGLALTFEFVFQMTFFAAVMVYGGRREERARMVRCSDSRSSVETSPSVISTVSKKQLGVLLNKSLSNGNCIDPKLSNGLKPIEFTALPYLAELKSRPKFFPENASLVSTAPAEKLICHQRFFANFLAPLISSHLARILIPVAFLTYLCVSLYGCSIVKSSLSPTKVLLANSPVTSYYRFADQTIDADLQPAHVVVAAPPDFNIPGNVQLFYAFVDELETIEDYSIGKTSTELWIRDYTQWAEVIGMDDFYELIPLWLDSPENARWRTDVKLGSIPASKADVNASIIRAFQFRTYFRHMGTYEDRVRMMKRWRAIYSSANYTHFRASIYNEYNIYSDQIVIMSDNVLQDAGVAMLMIFGISLFMITNTLCMFWVAYFLLTVEAGVIGMLKLISDAELDPSTVVTIAMSVGFSVDYLLHVAHAWTRSGCRRQGAKVRDSLLLIGWPICQATISTSLGVIGLVFVDGYLVRIFFMTVFTVVTLGLLHGLFVLPSVLATLDG